MKIEISNQQKVKKVNLAKLERDLKEVCRYLKISAPRLSVLLCDNTFIRKLNVQFLGRKTATDVLSFFLEDDFKPGYLGEVIVSVEAAVKVSRGYGNSWQRELLLYLIHGILHLAGYDDRTERKRRVMKAKEEEILSKLKM